MCLSITTAAATTTAAAAAAAAAALLMCFTGRAGDVGVNGSLSSARRSLSLTLSPCADLRVATTSADPGELNKSIQPHADRLDRSREASGILDDRMPSRFAYRLFSPHRQHCKQ